MNRFITLLTGIALISTLSACGEKTYTADYLATDKTKRVEILEACKLNKQSTENCTNANLAQASINKEISTKQRQIDYLKFKKQQTSRRLAKYPNAPSKTETEQKIKQYQDLITQAESELAELKQH